MELGTWRITRCLETIYTSTESLSVTPGDNGTVTTLGDKTLLTAPTIIRVGPQPLQPQKYITSVLKTLAEDHIGFILSKNQRAIDRSLLNATSETLKADSRDLSRTLKSSPWHHGSVMSQVCPYAKALTTELPCYSAFYQLMATYLTLSSILIFLYGLLNLIQVLLL